MKISRYRLRKIINEEIGKLAEKESISEAIPAFLVPLLSGGALSAAATTATGAGAATLSLAPGFVAGLIGLGFAAIAAPIAGAIWWAKKRREEQERIATAVESQKLGSALLVYNALKGLGTDEKTIREIILAHRDDIQRLYDEFGKVLEIVDDTGSGDLIEWLEDDGMGEEATIVRFIVMGEL